MLLDLCHNVSCPTQKARGGPCSLQHQGAWGRMQTQNSTPSQDSTLRLGAFSLSSPSLFSQTLLQKLISTPAVGITDSQSSDSTGR